MFGRMFLTLGLGLVLLGLDTASALAQAAPYDLSPLAETLAQDSRFSQRRQVLLEGKARNHNQPDQRSRRLVAALAAPLRQAGFQVSTIEQNPSGTGKDWALVQLDYEDRGGRLLVRAKAVDFLGGDMLAQGFVVVEDASEAAAPQETVPQPESEEQVPRGQETPDPAFRLAVTEAIVVAPLLDGDTDKTAIYQGFGLSGTWFLQGPWAVNLTLVEASATAQDNEDENLSQPFSGQCSLYEASGEYHWHLKPNRRGWNFLLGLGYVAHECVNKLESDGQKVTFSATGAAFYGEAQYIWDTGLFLGFHLPGLSWASASTESDAPTNYSLQGTGWGGMVFGYAF